MLVRSVPNCPILFIRSSPPLSPLFNRAMVVILITMCPPHHLASHAKTRAKTLQLLHTSTLLAVFLQSFSTLLYLSLHLPVSMPVIPSSSVRASMTVEPRGYSLVPPVMT